jgi:nucleotide-binding universal stress UspA family protein
MYKRILIVLDTRPVSRAAVDEGLRLAAAHGAEVTFIAVLPHYPLPISEAPFLDGAAEREFELAAQANADKLLAEARDAAEEAGVMSHTMVGSGEDATAVVLDAARHRRSDLIVVATEGRNALMRLLTGSVIPGLITAAPVPVLVCRPPEAPQAAATPSTRAPRRRAARKRAAASAGPSQAST